MYDNLETLTHDDVAGEQFNDIPDTTIAIDNLNDSINGK